LAIWIGLAGHHHHAPVMFFLRTCVHLPANLALFWIFSVANMENESSPLCVYNHLFLHWPLFTSLANIIKMKLAACALLSAVGSAAAFAPASFGVSRATQSTELYARKPFISGNWKLNPQTREEAITLASEIAATVGPDSPDADVALFVPYVFIDAALNAVGDKLTVGAEVGFAIV
jgi:hypothetical protein